MDRQAGLDSREQLHYAYELEQKSEFMEAARQYFLLVQNFPSSEEAGVGLQRLARCLFEMENYWTSYQAIEQVIETYPNTGRMSDLVEIELRIAKKLMVSQTPDLLSGNDANIRDANIRRALTIIGSVIEHDPYGPVAAEAYLVKGEGHLFINEIQAARAAFETVRDEFPRSDYVERARLGILTCDSLMGQATQAELQEQIEVVREFERERMGRSREEMDEMDEVENSIRQLAEVEAGKMMDQAEQYRRMGTRDGVKASEFLYKEIVRRYPGTPQAEESMARLNNIVIPREASRLTKIVKGINLNPFSYNKDPEPPWIVPQMAPEDMVMVDSGLGPIIGVPETGDLPSTSYSASVRPAALPEQNISVGDDSGNQNFSPISAAPRGSALDYSNGTSGQRMYSSAGDTFQPNRPPARNPIPTISDSDLVLPPGSIQTTFGASSAFTPPPPAGQYTHPYQQGGVYEGGNTVSGYNQGYGQPGYGQAPYGQPAPGYGQPSQYSPAPAPATHPATGAPSLGAPTDYYVPYSDLVGPVPTAGGAATGGYSNGGYNNGYSDGYNGGYNGYGAPTQPAPMPGGYSGYNSAPQNPAAYPPPTPARPQTIAGGVCTFGEDLR
ncbi:MAG: hypothetical protein LIQ31_14445 [Planctomycetes bacterium]|nr:hypothetical protein [Planctomycetota bacterium]